MSQDIWGETGGLGGMHAVARRRNLSNPRLRAMLFGAVLFISACLAAFTHLQVPLFLAWPTQLPPRLAPLFPPYTLSVFGGTIRLRQA